MSQHPLIGKTVVLRDGQSAEGQPSWLNVKYRIDSVHEQPDGTRTFNAFVADTRTGVFLKEADLKDSKEVDPD